MNGKLETLVRAILRGGLGALVGTVVLGAAVLSSSCMGPADSRPPVAPVWGDLDGDNQPDQLFIEHTGNTSLISFSLSGPRAGDQLSSTISASIVTAADVDGDGDLDLVAASLLGSEVWLNDGSGRFTALGLRSRSGLQSTADNRPHASGSIVAVSNPAPVALTRPEMAPGIFVVRRGLRSQLAGLSSASNPPSQPRAPPPYTV
jgi:hypothetical protein